MNEALYYGGMAFAIVMGITTIILFFAFNIPKIIGDLTGINAKRAINKLRDDQTEDKKRGLSAKMSDSGRIKTPKSENKSAETMVLSEDVTQPLDNMPGEGSEETAVLGTSIQGKCIFELIIDEVYIHAEPII